MTWRKSEGACLDEAENKGLKNDATLDEYESLFYILYDFLDYRRLLH